MITIHIDFTPLIAIVMTPIIKIINLISMKSSIIIKANGHAWLKYMF